MFKRSTMTLFLFEREKFQTWTLKQRQKMKNAPSKIGPIFTPDQSAYFQ